MGRFHNYSFGNILEIARQKPDATRVAGLYAWNQLGRKVKKGEHGIRILAPVIGVRRKKDEEAEKDIRTQNQAVLVGFRAAYVFDVSQTEGTELPEFSERVSGSAGEYRDRLVDFVIAQGIGLEFKESIAPALGMSYGGKIALLPGQPSAEEFSTLVHELAHEMLHKAERRTATTKTVRETEAEAVAFVVGKTIGLETGRASADYIHLYHGNAALLTESLEVIQKTSAVILSALENPATDATEEQDPGLAQAICVVGDDDQTIYQWRGGDISNIISFEKRYAPVKPIRLQENFRSSEGIVETARVFIAQNTQRLPKAMIPTSAQTYEQGDICALSFDEPRGRRKTVSEARHGDLGSDMSVNIIPLRTCVEPSRPVDTVAVEQCHRGHLQFDGPLDKLLRLRSTFQEAEGA
jgi:hypothetical protein